MKKIILIIGGLITVVLTALWYYNIITEPAAALGAAILTFLGYFFTEDGKEKPIKKKTKIKQVHNGDGDNVGGDKIVKK